MTLRNTVPSAKTLLLSLSVSCCLCGVAYAQNGHDETMVLAQVDKSRPAGKRFEPLFPRQEAPSWKAAIYFVARDPEAMRTMSFTRKDAAIRANALEQHEADYKLVQRGSPQALSLGKTMLTLALQQAIYFEYLKGVGMADASYPDTLHEIKVFRSKAIYFADQLIEQFPKDSNVDNWMSVSLASRLRISDPSATAQALAFARKSKSGAANRVAWTGLALDLARGKPTSQFGSLQSAIEQAPDSETKAAFTLIAAEQVQVAKSPSKAIELYEDAGRKGAQVRLPNGKPGIFVERAAIRIADIAYQRNPRNVDTEVINTLRSFGIPEVTRNYIERVALSTLQNQPQQAMTHYQDIRNLGQLPGDKQRFLELRILDIALLGRDPESAENQWKRLKNMPDGFETPGLEQRVLETQGLNWDLLAKNTNSNNVDRFVRLHDWFAPQFNNYGNDDRWTLRTLEALFRIQRNEEVARRADAVATQSKNAPTKLEALRYAARARENILHIGKTPQFRSITKISAGKNVVDAYIRTLDTLREMTNGQERLDCIFQAAMVTFQAGEIPEARKRFEAAISSESKTPYAAQSVSFLLTHSMGNQDHEYTEQIARLAEGKRVVPSEARHRDLRKIIENAVYAHAEVLMRKKDYEASATKFIAFAKEFPKADRAPNALDNAAKAYIAAHKIELAIEQMEALLARYPQSSFAFATRWAAAEHSRSIGQFLRAAKHYEAFAQTWPKESLKNKAWVKAAEMHKGTGRLSDAVSCYEKYLQQVPTQAEKLQIAKDIAEMHAKNGKPGDALGAYDRVAKIAGRGDDQIWAYLGRAEIYIKESEDGKARGELVKLIGLSPSSQTGLKLIANGKFYLGQMEAKELQNIDLMSQDQLEKAMRKALSDYQRVKGLLLSACEVPGLEWCPVGYFEASQTAEKLAKSMLEVEAPPALNPTEAKNVQSLSMTNGRKLSQEAITLSEQAERAVASGAPDAEWTRRIREWASEHKGYRDDYLLNSNPK